MCSNITIELMSNFTRNIFVASIVGQEDDAILILNFFDHAIFCFANYFLFSLSFNSNFIQMSPLNLARHFCGIN